APADPSESTGPHVEALVLEPRQGASTAYELLLQQGALRVSYLALRIGELDLMRAEVVERELVPHVAEEVLLPPPREHPASYREQGQCFVRRDDRRLMADLLAADGPLDGAEEPLLPSRLLSL